MSDEQSVEEEWPEPKRPGKTHWNECWKVRGHHNCAVARVRKLRERLEEVEEDAARYADSNMDLNEGYNRLRRRADRLEEAVREAIPTMRRASENTEVPDEVRRSLWSIGYRLRSALDSREDEGEDDDWYKDGDDPLIGPGPYGYGDEKLQTVPENLSNHDLAQLLTFAEDLGEEGGQDRNPFVEEAARRLSDAPSGEGERDG